jgi:hypothetical protein
MPLPLGHPYQDGAPTIEDDIILYLDNGASNGPVGAVVNTEFQPHNTLRSLIYKHNDTIVGFADPPNDQSVTTYSRLDETGTQNRNSFLIEMMRETTRKKVCVITAGQSAVGITNISTGFNSPITIGQLTDLCTAARGTVKRKISFALVNVTDGDARFGASPEALGTIFDDYSENLRTATGNPNLPIIMVGLGAKPPVVGEDVYPSWIPHRDYFRDTYTASNFHYVMTDDLDATHLESDQIHWNGKGHKVIAGRILSTLKSIGIIPYEKTVNIALSGQSNAGSLGGSTESASTAGIEALMSTVRSFIPKHATSFYKGTDGGSGSNEVSNAVEYWWHSGDDVRGTELIDFLEGSNARHDYIYHDLVATDANSSLTLSEYKEIQLKIFNQYWKVNPKAVIVLRVVGRRTSFSNLGGAQMVREAQWQLAEENAKVILGAEVYDLALHDTVHVADSDIEKEGNRIGRVIAKHKGANVTGSVYGAKPIAAVRSGTTVTVTIQHDGGTGFTPISGIQGFNFFDDASEVTISSALGDGVETITLTLAEEPSGVETLYYGYDFMTELNDGGAIVSGIVRDNSPQALPLRTCKIVLD